ncbi:cysteine desulfurase [Aquirufa antheringensis]|uniref:cysteine desulfurase n=1 Tax=Aquirufa antheringensis TaxID=2516559 RepID=UPI001032C07A|nr:cysteine desulfurase [Aquirufa antheringensis]MCL9968759.1 cysteine desulfurase [Aquirufa antheringensis]TBH70618.1 cysteine desulfurase [Aquirufa antheringensis]USQ04275.1 cysteine desulfurase [Aquirufa antheringensis]
MTETLNIDQIRADFPVLHQQVNKAPLIYFDNAATTQKPKAVIDALSAYYEQDNANIHRGIHTLAERATTAYELTRKKLAAFLNAPSTDQIIFTSGTTAGINLVAQTFGRANVGKGDQIIVSNLEHHSNIVPWQMIAEEKGAEIKVIPVSDAGVLDIEAYKALLNPKVKLVAVNHVSNAIGTINPIVEIISLAHEVGAKVLIDGAQSVAHLAVDVQALDMDFFVFSAHKLFGPTGVGVLYGKRDLLESMPPYQGGGEMIKEVSFSGTTYNELPYKFEAGTPNIADVIAFGAALDYVQAIPSEALAAQEEALLAYATQKLQLIPGLRIVGTAPEKIAVISFVIDGVHPQDIGVLLDKFGIAIRTGHHCAQPLMQRYELVGTCRASFAFYNTFEEIDRFVLCLEKTLQMLG